MKASAGSFSAWRLNHFPSLTFILEQDKGQKHFQVGLKDGKAQISMEKGPFHALSYHFNQGVLHASIEGERETARVTRSENTIFVERRGEHSLFLSSEQNLVRGQEGEGHLQAPMPGKIIRLMVQPGDIVEEGTPLVVMEAMKMEHAIKAPAPGRVVELPFPNNTMVQEGQELAVIEPLDEEKVG